MLVASGRVGLRLYDHDELVAVVEGDRRGRSWADGYPTEGDVIVGKLLLDAGAPLPTAQDPWGPLQVCDLADGLAVGGIGFKGWPDPDGQVEIGYGIAAPRQGRGIATDAVRAAIALATAHGARALVADTDPDNAASQRVLARTGFVRWEPPRAADEQAGRAPSLWWRLSLAR